MCIADIALQRDNIIYTKRNHVKIGKTSRQTIKRMVQLIVVI